MNQHDASRSEADGPPDERVVSPANDAAESTNADNESIVDTEALAQRIEPTPVPEGYSRLPDEAEATIRRDGLTQFYGLRRMWSGWLIGWVSVLICFQIVLTFSIGLGLLDYKEYDWFLPLVTAQNFLQIVGMAIVVVRFLHSDSKQAANVDSF